MTIWSRMSILGVFVDFCVMRKGPFFWPDFGHKSETPKMAKIRVFWPKLDNAQSENAEKGHKRLLIKIGWGAHPKFLTENFWFSSMSRFVDFWPFFPYKTVGKSLFSVQPFFIFKSEFWGTISTLGVIFAMSHLGRHSLGLRPQFRGGFGILRPFGPENTSSNYRLSQDNAL